MVSYHIDVGKDRRFEEHDCSLLSAHFVLILKRQLSLIG